jgi:hypothetical protein
VQSLARSLFGAHPPDQDVIAAPPNLDRQMAVVPPRDGSPMPVISPRR